MSRVSVITVSYNTREPLREQLQLLTLDPEVFECIVVDNASVDGSAAMVTKEFPDVRLLALPRNVGFGEANNLGMDAMHGDLALLLNSDCRPKPGAIGRLARLFEDPALVAAGGALFDRDGRVQPSAAHALTLRAVLSEQFLWEQIAMRLGRPPTYWREPRDRGLPEETEQLMGACLMMRPVERFNPRFFLYVEDTDLCARLRKHGRILYVPEAHFEHDLGASTSGRRAWSVGMYNRGKELYFALHQGTIAMVTAWCLNRVGALLRLILKPREASLWLRVLFAPFAGPPLPPDALERREK